MAHMPGSIRRPSTGEARHLRNEPGVPQKPWILCRTMPEQTDMTWLRRLAEQSPVLLLLSLTAVGAASQHAQDDVRRNPVLFHAASIHRIAAPPMSGPMIVQGLEAANPVNEVHERHQPLLVLEQEHVMMQPEQRAMLIVDSVENPRMLVLKASGDRTQWPLSRLENEMYFTLGDVTRVQPRALLPQRCPQQLQQRLEFRLTGDNSPLRYAPQRDVVPPKRNRRQSCETWHHGFLHA